MSVMKVGARYRAEYTVANQTAGTLIATVIESNDNGFRIKYKYQFHPEFDKECSHSLNYIRIFEDKWELMPDVTLPEDLFTI